MEEELILDTIQDEQKQNISIAVSVVIENGQVTFPTQDLVMDSQGIKRGCGKDHSQIFVQITAQDLIYEDMLGKGVGGYVMKAKYKHGDITLAVKTVNIQDKSQRHQMLNDLKVLLTGGKCDFIVECYGAFYDAEEGTVKIILEFMDIGSLRNLMKILHDSQYPGQEITKQVKMIDEQMLATIAYQILMGLQFLHITRKQVHRDIKPENILIDQHGNVKLTDFGISKKIENTCEMAGSFVGTVLYMSPEQLAGKGCTFSSDIWSFGIVMLELATGYYPYPQKNFKSFFDFIMNLQQSPAPTVNKDFPFSELFTDFIEKCLNKEAINRYTAMQLIQHEWITQNLKDKEDFSNYIRNFLNTTNNNTYNQNQQQQYNQDQQQYNQEQQQENIQEEIQIEEDMQINLDDNQSQLYNQPILGNQPFIILNQNQQK